MLKYTYGAMAHVPFQKFFKRNGENPKITITIFIYRLARVRMDETKEG